MIYALFWVGLLALIVKTSDLYPELNDIHGTSDEAYAFFVCVRPDANPSDQFLFYALSHSIQRINEIQKSKRNTKKRDIVVLVCNLTSEAQVESMKQFGAIVVNVDAFSVPGTLLKSYIDVNTKFHFWRLTNWKRLLYMDIDIFFREKALKIWDEPATQSKPILKNITDHNLTISSYVFAAVVDLCCRLPIPQHPHPNGTYFNSGVFMFNPSMDLFELIIKTMHAHTEDLVFPDQDVLNLVFSLNSSMPWNFLDWNYNRFGREATDDKLNDNIMCIHRKLWDTNLAKSSNTSKASVMWYESYNFLKSDRFLHKIN